MPDRVGIVESIHVGQQDQAIGAHHLRYPRRQPVIIAVADLLGGDGIVFVDDRHGAQAQQRLQGAAGIEVPFALFGIGQGQQDLGDDATACREVLLVQRHQADEAFRLDDGLRNQLVIEQHAANIAQRFTRKVCANTVPEM